MQNSTKPANPPNSDEHAHEHGGFFGQHTELIASLLCGLFLGIGFLLHFSERIPDWTSLVSYVLAYIFGGYFTTKEAIGSMRRGRFEIDSLMILAALGAALLGEWAEGALLLFLFSLGHSLEHFAIGKARKSIEALTKLAPKTAIVRRGDLQIDISVEELRVNDVIIVKPNSHIAADGIVIKGSSSVNQSSITGESIPVDKQPWIENLPTNVIFNKIPPENRVYAGTINGTGGLEIQVVREESDSTLAKLVQLVNESESQKSPTQQFTDKFEKIFVPSVLVLVALLLLAFLVIEEPFSDSFYRAMAVLVAASPCALAISTPSAVLSGIARAARGGVLVKGGAPLEDLGGLTAIAFDKTGTLTEGKPKLTEIFPYGSVTSDHLMGIAADVEALSDHPLAAAVVNGVKERLGERKGSEASDLQSVTGKGVIAMWEGEQVYIGNRSLFETELSVKIPEDLRSKATELESKGNTTMIVRKGDTFLGIIGLMDVPKDEAADVILLLKQVGIRRITMITGDNQNVATSVAKQIGLTDAWGDLLPEDKVKAIEELMAQENKVAMVGDGVNDAPALAKSTVGIAMGAAGSDVALETADIALMTDQLTALPFAIGLSRKSKGIIKQNLWVSLGVTAFLIPATIFGFAGIGVAVLIHEGSTLLVVFNALRLLAYNNSHENGET
ncbi:heavy metal translocating P-type ATPase [Paenibacillus sp. UMB7766-LJ446]|uniref:heavy metal translocating P-type ATPase n=1 Tax=Paenibacillus sp. UMB7766-LJ446 TaxID=3046313 RepID=UPI00254FCCD3|nr:heavy metal translocating P-type ATPase [Paenibacillus sp. UMB7766-LJ446]MDK8193083.1 heavy metal translocating P-type ATPase [Paenibacillus sp. UMB7766-LJ446]